jgi:hypothetical protein
VAVAVSRGAVRAIGAVHDGGTADSREQIWDWELCSALVVFWCPLQSAQEQQKQRRYSTLHADAERAMPLQKTEGGREELFEWTAKSKMFLYQNRQRFLY